MPVYVYQAVDVEKGCDCCREPFELLQTMSEKPLVVCHACGQPVRRLIQPVAVSVGKKHMLSDDNIKKHGFTKLVNEGGGKYRKI